MARNLRPYAQGFLDARVATMTLIIPRDGCSRRVADLPGLSALAEAVTRLSDREDPVPDAVWEQAARHYGEQELGVLVMAIGMAKLLKADADTCPDQRSPGAGTSAVWT